MAYVGNPIDTQNTFQSLVGKRFSGDGSTTDFTLDVAPSSTLDIEVFVGNVRQDPNSAYTLSGTTLTFTGAPPSGTNNIYVVHQAKSVGTINAPANSITSDQLNTALLTGATDIGAGIADADLFLVDDGAGGTLRKTAASRIKTYVGGFDVSSITGATAIGAIPDNADEFVMSDGGTLKRIDYKFLVPYGSLAGNFSHGNQTGISSFSYTKILLATENYNRGLTFGSNKITIPTGGAGDYMVSVTLNVNLYGADKLQAAKGAIYINGSGSKYFGNDFRDNPGRDASIVYNDVIQFNDDDYIEIYAYIGHTQSTSSYQAANSTHVTLFKINNA